MKAARSRDPEGSVAESEGVGVCKWILSEGGLADGMERSVCGGTCVRFVNLPFREGRTIFSKFRGVAARLNAGTKQKRGSNVCD